MSFKDSKAMALIFGDKIEQDEDIESDIKIGDKIKLTRYAQEFHPLAAKVSCYEVKSIKTNLQNNMTSEVMFEYFNRRDVRYERHYRRSLVTLVKPITKEQQFEAHFKKEQEIAEKQRSDDESRKSHNDALKKIQDDFNRPFAKRYALMTCDLVGNPWNRE
jgi:hypothetical protein